MSTNSVVTRAGASARPSMGEPPEQSARSGHRIVSAGTEGVTPPDAAECEPATAPRPMAFERFDGVDGAAGIIAARRRQQWTKDDLVGADEQYEELAHESLTR